MGHSLHLQRLGKQQEPAGKAGGAAQGPGAEGRGFNTLSNFFVVVSCLKKKKKVVRWAGDESQVPVMLL